MTRLFPAQHVAVEPDRCQELAVNLIRKHQPFVVEIDPTLRGMKDVCIVSVRGALVRRDTTHDYIKKVGLRADEAAQYAVNLIRNELSFEVACAWLNEKTPEWTFHVEMVKR